MQKRSLYLLKTVSVFTIAHSLTPGVTAQEKMSLEQAINSYLANSCAGLLNASVDANGNLIENDNFSIDIDSLTLVGDARVSNFRLIDPADETGANARTNFAYNATLPAIRAIATDTTTSEGRGISFEVQTAYGGTFDSSAANFATADQEQQFYADLNAETGIDLNTPGAAIADEEFFLVSDFVESFGQENEGFSIDLDLSFEHGYENRIEFQQNGANVSELLNGSDFDTATGVADIEQDYIASISKRLDTDRFGAGLVQICEQEGIAQDGTFVAEDFQFGVSVASDLFGGIRGSANGNSSSLGSAGLSGLTQSASGASAVRAQEDVRRRENDVISFIERLRRKFKREKETETYEVASAGEFGAYQPPSSKYSFMFDALGGINSIDRSTTDLENGFSAESVFVSIGGAVAYQGEAADETVWLIGGNLGYENLELDSESDVANSSTSESEFFSGSAFVTASLTPSAGKLENPAQYAFTASFTYGDGDQDYDRRFEARYQPIVGGDTVTASDRLASSIGQSYQTASLQASVTKPLGNLLFTPRVGLSYTRFETDGHVENNVDGADNGLALEYEASEDEWLEGRVGASVVALLGVSESATLEIGASADAVFVEDAETPVRVAYFRQDLRPQSERATLLYNVDDLDSEFYDLGVSVAAQFSNGFRPYAAIYTREGHEYISSTGAVFGFKSTF